ncbi:DUF4230 domain-containing protein [Bacillus sp. CGMCC 1.16607]|uniref:DUF4230 domain-containing protein n=1 Tax=Bacillus sp. CGMCC 1.16607 TaxID=3351842 RepID=UPI00362E40B6
MNKKDQARMEIEKAKRESAATIALGGQAASMPHRSGTRFKLFLKYWNLKLILVALVLAVVISSILWFFSGSTFKKESTTFVEQVQELATLATAEAHVKTIIEQQDNKLFGKDIQLNIPGTKRELLLVVPATVIAGVNLKEITSDNIKIDDEAKELEMILPHATFIQKPAIQMDKVRTFSDEGLFRGKVEWAEGFDIAAEAQKEIEKEAVEIGLLQTAENNAEKVLKEFFGTLGYSVKITFQ